jgi:peptidoglycan-N-acetylglucosamine deacetylase
MNILTFDVEEWYHIRFDDEFLNNSRLLNSLEKRLDYNINFILDMLDQHNQKASFFCLGEVARNSPGVIKLIDDRGHDIGCHSDSHRLVSSMSEKQFSDDLYTALDCIQTEIGKKVYMYRAPAFSITSGNMWAFDVMIDQGITIDSSIFPASRDYGGISNINFPIPKKIITPLGGSIKEFPMSVSSILGKKMIFTGGGYFRLWPYPVIKRIVAKEEYTMTYFHPRDFDYKQPKLEGLSLSRKFKSYYGLKRSLHKMDLLLNDFDFISISEANRLIDWNGLNG